MSINEEAQELQSLLDTLLDDVAYNDVTLKNFQAFELELMNSSSLNNLIELLLKDSLLDLDLEFATLTLVDTEYEIQRHLERTGSKFLECPELKFIDSNEELEKLYKQKLFPIFQSYNDAHLFLFSSEVNKPDAAWSLPLSRNHHLTGSYNICKQSGNHTQEDSATDFLQRLAAVVSVSLEISISKESLKTLGLIDPLTGVNNRRFFDQRLIEEVASVIRANDEISCLFIDIDHFKKVNDNYGHQAGDEILRGVAQIIRELVRSTDVVARYGGEEFIVLLSHKGKKKAAEIGERIRKTIEERIFTDPQHGDIKVTTSIGINSLNTSEHEGEVKDVASLFVVRADRALYQAKNNGRNRIEFYADNE
ncbi:MAG: sensor domain-containing diguanylate cyclase [Gammaproteobacteria bacterium]|nr:MAG: sensor domain-containing diguanylate cyclase [Gammaproteobacteria bacterium]RKZ71846.1 MAG: sensor domain-containing diguanylate cyclase [Gammaproteobacteria bacterium]